MAVPSISSISDVIGPALGGDLLQIVGADFADQVEVYFGSYAATVVRVRDAGADRVIDLRTPQAVPSVVSVTIRNLDAGGTPVPGEEVTEPLAYTFSRFNLVSESALARLFRAILRRLKAGVLENTGLTVSVDFDYGEGVEPVAQGAYAITLDSSHLPALTLSNIEIVENRAWSNNEIHDFAVLGPSGPEIQYQREPFVADITLDVIGASDSMIQALNLLQGVTSVLHRYRWVAIDRCHDDPSAGQVEFEIDPVGTTRSELAGGKDSMRVFIRPLRVRAFWLDAEDMIALDVTVAVEDVAVDSQSL